jgi:hypothetical protein
MAQAGEEQIVREAWWEFEVMVEEESVSQAVLGTLAQETQQAVDQRVAEEEDHRIDLA